MNSDFGVHSRGAKRLSRQELCVLKIIKNAFFLLFESNFFFENVKNLRKYGFLMKKGKMNHTEIIIKELL